MTTTRPEFSEAHLLGDGTPVTLRFIRPDDAAQLKRGFDRLSPASRYRRFFGGVTTLTDELLRYLTAVDGVDHVAIVAAIDQGGEEQGLGVARFIRLTDEPTVAEPAITVLDDAQGKGLGKLLGLTLARAAYERGIERFRGEILADNERVRQLLSDVGAVILARPGGQLLFDVELGAVASSSAGFEVVARRLLAAAASYVIGAFRSATGASPR